MDFNIKVAQSFAGDILVTATISKFDMMAADRKDKLLNYILIQVGDRLAQEIIEQQKDRIMELITPEQILSIVMEKIKSRISIVDAPNKSTT